MAEDKVLLTKFSKEGKEAGQVEVSSEVFGIEPNVHVLHQAVRRELANGRAGTACTKNAWRSAWRWQKPWKQKELGALGLAAFVRRYGSVVV